MPAPTFVDIDPDAFMQGYERSMARRSESAPKGWQPQRAPLGAPPHRNVIRIMPPHPNMVDPEMGKPAPIIGVRLHYSLGPAFNVACPCLAPYGQECPACDWVQALYNRAKTLDPTTAADLKDKAYNARATLKFSCNIVDLAKPEMGVQTWYFYDAVEKALQGCFLDDSMPPKFRNITHPMTGRNVLLMVGTKIGGGREKKEVTDWREIRAAGDASPLMDMDWLENLPDLSEQVFMPTSEQVVAVLKTGQRINRDGTMSLPAGHVPASLPAAPAPIPPAARVPIAAPPPVQPPVVTAPQLIRGRRPQGVPAAPPVPAAAPPVPAAPPAASRRQPMAAVTAPVEPEGTPWDRARALVFAAGFTTPKEITAEEIETVRGQNRLAPCFGYETDPSDAACQGCSLIVPCYGILHHILGLPAPAAR